MNKPPALRSAETLTIHFRKEKKNPNMRGLTESILATVFERIEIKT
jgi:hypothetical protein